MKNLPVDMKIVVVTDTLELVEARVTRSSKRSIIRYKINPRSASRWSPRRLRADEEGTTWARGWDGVGVDALRAEMALRRST